MKAKLEQLIRHLTAEAGKQQGASLEGLLSLLTQVKQIRAKMEERA